MTRTIYTRLDVAVLLFAIVCLAVGLAVRW